MHLVLFGLTVSSSWGNGHATLWRSLIKAMLRRGHTVVFYEHDVPYYAGARDLHSLPVGATLRLYEDFSSIKADARRDLDDADLALCTSFCPDSVAACRLILDSRAAIKAFYDLDTPITLDAFSTGYAVPYLLPEGLAPFDLVLSYTGGKAIDELKTQLGARNVAPLYGSVDPENHFPVPAQEQYRSTLSYLGTYADDRQRTLTTLFLEPAAQLPDSRFLIGGAQYPQEFPWASNIAFVRHVPPSLHPAFFCSGRATLNVTRAVMARYGHCPSGRLFEAAACGVPVLTDTWEGLDTFFVPGREILPVTTAEDVLNIFALSDSELGAIATAARERTLAEHTGDNRVRTLEALCESLRTTPPHTDHKVQVLPPPQPHQQNWQEDAESLNQSAANPQSPASTFEILT
jgi:spore maturation protein CgeB